MPIINGQVHILKRNMPTHHKVAYGVGIAAAIAVVVLAWVFLVSSQVKGFFEGAQQLGADTQAAVSEAQKSSAPPNSSSTPSPSSFAPALHAAIENAK